MLKIVENKNIHLFEIDVVNRVIPTIILHFRKTDEYQNSDKQCSLRLWLSKVRKINMKYDFQSFGRGRQTTFRRVGGG